MCMYYDIYTSFIFRCIYQKKLYIYIQASAGFFGRRDDIGALHLLP